MHKVISRSDAMASGEKFYFTGVPCVYGGLAIRRAGDGKCSCGACKSVRRIQSEKYRRHRLATIGVVERVKVPRAGKVDRKLSDAGKERKRRYYYANREKILGHAKDLAEKRGGAPYYNAEKSKAYYLANREMLMEKARYWGLNNPEKRAICRSARHAAEILRIPAWFGELDQFVVGECGSLAKARELATGIVHHTDHMIPMRAKKASGLHCGLNLQVIPAYLNLAKSNRMTMTRPWEWLKFI